MDAQKTIIEVNGVKLEVDLRNAKRIDTLQVGSRVKCLVKQYSDFQTYPGVVVGFEPFDKLPTIIVAYIETSYSSAGLKFKSYNAETKDFEIVADLDNNNLEVDRAEINRLFDKEITDLQIKLKDVQDKRAFFNSKFSSYFMDQFISEV